VALDRLHEIRRVVLAGRKVSVDPITLEARVELVRIEGLDRSQVGIEAPESDPVAVAAHAERSGMEAGAKQD
jgi:hypothetical protein